MHSLSGHLFTGKSAVGLGIDFPDFGALIGGSDAPVNTDGGIAYTPDSSSGLPSCPADTPYDPVTKTCGPSINALLAANQKQSCPAGSYYDNILGKCAKDVEVGMVSSCPTGFTLKNGHCEKAVGGTVVKTAPVPVQPQPVQSGIEFGDIAMYGGAAVLVLALGSYVYKKRKARKGYLAVSYAFPRRRGRALRGLGDAIGCPPGWDAPNGVCTFLHGGEPCTTPSGSPGVYDNQGTCIYQLQPIPGPGSQQAQPVPGQQQTQPTGSCPPGQVYNPAVSGGCAPPNFGAPCSTPAGGGVIGFDGSCFFDGAGNPCSGPNGEKGTWNSLGYCNYTPAVVPGPGPQPYVPPGPGPQPYVPPKPQPVPPQPTPVVQSSSTKLAAVGVAIGMVVLFFSAISYATDK